MGSASSRRVMLLSRLTGFSGSRSLVSTPLRRSETGAGARTAVFRLRSPTQLMALASYFSSILSNGSEERGYLYFVTIWEGHRVYKRVCANGKHSRLEVEQGIDGVAKRSYKGILDGVRGTE